MSIHEGPRAFKIEAPDGKAGFRGDRIEVLVRARANVRQGSQGASLPLGGAVGRWKGSYVP
jgi:hypothetical protein